jgi:DNA helicase IV
VPRFVTDRTDVHRLSVRGVDLEQQVLDNNRETKGHQQSGEGISVNALLDESSLHDVPDQAKDRYDDEKRPYFGNVKVRSKKDGHVPGDDGHVAVGQVDHL